MGGCGPHNPCQSTAENDSTIMATNTPTPVVAAPISGGCCSTKKKDIVIQPPVAVTSTPITSTGTPAPIVGGCCSTKASSVAEEHSPEELSLMEMMENLTNSATFDKASAIDCGGGCQCKDPNEGVQKGCCVVICLKTLETLKFLARRQESLLACRPRTPKRAAQMMSRGLGGRCNNNNNMACCGSPALCK